MNKIDEVIHHWRNIIFPPATDQVWQEWMEFRGRGAQDLVGLLKSECRLEFRARALFLLLAPDLTLAPFPWQPWRSRTKPAGESYLGTSSYENMNDLPADLLPHAAELIAVFSRYLKDLPSAVKNAEEAQVAYNRCIHKLLARPELPDETKEELFRHFSVNDVIAFYSMDDASGYNPFRRLLRDPAVDEKWKRKADAQVQAIITAEQSGKARPREDYEDALKCYGHCLEEMIFNGKPPYSAEFFAGQIKFLLSSGGRGWFSSSSDLWRVLRVLVGDQYAELRYELVRAAVLTAKHFGLWTGENIKFGNDLCAEYGHRAAELTQKLGQAIAAGVKQVAEDAAEAAKHRAAEQALLAKMR